MRVLHPRKFGSAMLAVATMSLWASPGAAQGSDGGASVQATVDDADIIVTAQRRAQRLQDVPIAITALQSDALRAANVESLADLPGKVPGLSIGGWNGPNGVTLLSVRGVSGQSSPIGGSQATAVYLDGVYLSKPDAGFFGLRDVDRIEVLRGPQGTLYGRNATAGAINIITQQPTETVRGAFDISYGNYDSVTAGGYLSGPLANHLAGSVSMTAASREGYFTNALTGNDFGKASSFSGRAKLRYDNQAGFDATLAADYTKRLTEDGEVSVTMNGNKQVYSKKFFSISPVLEPQVGSTVESYGAALTMNLAVSDELEVTSITSWRRFSYDAIYDADGLGALPLVDIHSYNENETFNQELRGVYDAGPLNVTLGANYYEESGEELTDMNPPGSVFVRSQIRARSTPYTSTNVRAIAAFGQGEIEVAQGLTLVAGVRWNHESRRFLVDPNRIVAGVPATVVYGKVSDSVILPMAGINYKPSDDVLLYAKVSEGYLAPGYFRNNGLASPAGTFGPEKLRAYEAGLKTQWLDKRLTVNLAGFYYDYNDLQVRSFIAPGEARVQNAAGASVKGAEVELRVQPLPGLTLNGQVTYSKAVYTNFCDGISGGSPQADDPLCVAGDFPRAQRRGNALNLAPRWSGGAGVTFELPLGGARKLVVNGNYSFESQSYFTQPNIRISSTTGWGQFDARATVALGEFISIYAYGRNLNNNQHLVQGLLLSPGLGVGVVSDPRTYGLGAAYRF